MPQGTIWIEQRSTRTGELLRVGIVCEACAQDTPALEGWSRRPWTGEPRECSWCGDDLAPELKPAKLVAVLAMVLLMAVPAEAQTTPIVLGNIADIVSTEVAVRVADVREANPIIGQSTARRVALKSASTIYSVGAVLGGVTLHNIRVARQHAKR